MKFISVFTSIFDWMSTIVSSLDLMVLDSFPIDSEGNVINVTVLGLLLTFLIFSIVSSFVFKLLKRKGNKD